MISVQKTKNSRTNSKYCMTCVCAFDLIVEKKNPKFCCNENLKMQNPTNVRTKSVDFYYIYH